MNTNTIKLLVAVVISLAVGFFAGMYVSAYQNDDATIGEIMEDATLDDLSEAREQAREARIKTEKGNLVRWIDLLESDLGTSRYNWSEEDVDNLSVEYLQEIKSDLEAEAAAQSNQ